jgi:hypothetical protein
MWVGNGRSRGNGEQLLFFLAKPMNEYFRIHCFENGTVSENIYVLRLYPIQLFIYFSVNGVLFVAEMFVISRSLLQNILGHF